MQEELNISASNFGFDLEWINEVTQQYGDECLADVNEASRHGFSNSFIKELLVGFGPEILNLLVSISNKTKLMGVTGEIPPNGIIQGVDTAFIDVLVEKWLPIITQKYLPIIAEKYGPQIIQFVIDFLLKSLTK